MRTWKPLSVITFLLCLALTANGEPKVFTQTARVEMGARESRDDVREFAKLEARRLVLEQVGVYIEGETDLVQRVQETEGSFQDTTEFNKRVQAVTAGVVKMEVAGEEWKMEADKFVLYLTCSVTVDPDDVGKRIADLLKDRQKIADFTRLQGEIKRLDGNLASLRDSLTNAQPSQVAGMKDRIRQSLADLTVNDMIKTLLASNDPEEIISISSEAIQIHPDWFLLYGLRGQAYATQGLDDKAIEEYNTSIRINSSWSLVYLWRGNALARKGLKHDAYESYDKAIQLDLATSFRYFGFGVDKWNEYFTGSILEQSNTDYDLALRIDREDPVSYLIYGVQASWNSQTDKAISYFDESIQLYPRFAAAYYQLGYVYDCKLNQSKKAIEYYNTALRLAPSYSTAYLGRGNSYRTLMLYDQAIADYDKALFYESGDLTQLTDILVNRGNTYFNKGLYDVAIADYTVAILKNEHQIDSLFSDTQWRSNCRRIYSFLYIARADAFYAKGDYQPAINDLTTVINFGDNISGNYLKRASAYSHLRKDDFTVADCDRALSIEPDNYLALRIRGDAYYGKSEYDRAISDYNRVLQNDPNDSETWYNMGLTYFYMGDMQNARAASERARDLGNSSAQKILNSIR